MKESDRHRDEVVVLLNELL